MKILIVGAGPVGMTLAARLSQASIEVVLIDKRRSLSILPRGIAVNQYTLSVFEQIGILPRILASGIKVPRLNLYYAGKRFGTLGFSDARLAHPYFFHVRQSAVEQALAARLAELDLPIFNGAELVGLQQTENGVKARLEIDGKCKELRLDYVIGCDGGRSSCRDLASICTSIEGYGGHFALADVKLQGDALDSGETHYFLSRDGYLMLVPAPDGATRVIASSRSQLDEATPLLGPSDVEVMIAERSGRRAVVEQLI